MKNKTSKAPKKARSLHEVDMPRERWIELMANDDLQLTPEEVAGGWHWCNDFDGLLVGPGMGERENCHCFEAGHIDPDQRPGKSPKTLWSEKTQLQSEPPVRCIRLVLRHKPSKMRVTVKLSRCGHRGKSRGHGCARSNASA